ncbi:MAG: phosphoenolpyruvate--protein phosphotransferase, partial [Oscillospiraceae bacterium]|nr:phosphoenolpyruvate--protein phosphotransferase [Oscillospiraceae bacterium]
KMREAIGEDKLGIFSAHELMLSDETLFDNVEMLIMQKNYTAEYAVSVAIEGLVRTFKHIDDEYLRERSADVEDIGRRILDNLLVREEIKVPKYYQKVIIMSHEFLPSETMLFKKENLLGFIAQNGGATSHAAIIARTIGVPAVVGVDMDIEEAENKLAIIDGDEGKVILEPNRLTLKHYNELIKKREIEQNLLNGYIGKRTETLDGKYVPVLANVGSVADVETAGEIGAEGIGLMRSEFIFLSQKNQPTEEEQFEHYKAILEKAGGKRTVIRTFDIGADKLMKRIGNENEPNPALGFRGIRIGLRYHDFFIRQIKALYRASVYGKLSIMLPMITTEEELDEALFLIEKAKDELINEKNVYAENVKLGIMIETPSAALVSDKLAEKVDFFSIGTNDLTQYVMAADRSNSEVSYLYNYRDRAVLRAIKMTVENAHNAGILVGVCGESASDPELAEIYIAMGVDYFSVTPRSVLELRRHIMSLSAEQLAKTKKDSF